MNDTHWQRTPSRAARAAVLLALGAFACGGAAPPATAPAAHDGSIAEYLPLEIDAVYTYDTRSEESAEPGVLMLQIVRHGEITELGVGGRKQRLQSVPDGIINLTGGWVLKAPLDLGATWKGPAGTVAVTQVGKQVKVPAGQWNGCVETTETVAAPGQNRRIITTFCPKVGIAELVVEAQAGAEYVREVAVLRSFGAKVDVFRATPD